MCRPNQQKLEVQPRRPSHKGKQTIHFEIESKEANAPAHDTDLYVIVAEILRSQTGIQPPRFGIVCSWRDHAVVAGASDPSQVVVSAVQDVILSMGNAASCVPINFPDSEGFLELAVKRQINNILGLPPERTRRKIMQVAPVPGVTEAIYALCDDGTLWHNYGPNDWYQLLPIPQDNSHAVEKH